MKINQIKTAKGREGIEINKFRYRKDKTLANGEIYWRCTTRKCAVALKTNNAVTTIKSKPGIHNHEPPDSTAPSTPAVSGPQTPGTGTPSQQTPRCSTADFSSASSLDTPSLTELLSPYVTLTPAPPKFPQLEDENVYLRQKVAELTYTNEALTNRLISAEKKVIELEKLKSYPEKTTVASQTDNNYLNKQIPMPEVVSHAIPVPKEQTNKRQLVNSSSQTDKYAIDTLKGIHVLEADMRDLIDELRSKKSIAFAHTISRDSHNPRNMTAGVAAVFRSRFGKPQVEDRLTRFLAVQGATDEAVVYSLITKKEYNGKPTEQDYDEAFEDLSRHFNKERFSALICSPMGCVRDMIRLNHFAENISKFHRTTGVTVLIVTKEEKAQRVLRRGLSQPEFVKQLKFEIRRAEGSQNKNITKSGNTQILNESEAMKKTKSTQKPTQSTLKKAQVWYSLPDNEMKLYLDQIPVPSNTLLLDPAVSQLLKKSSDKEQIADTLEGCAIDNYDYILAPINDSDDDGAEGGTHWSLLLYVKETNTFYHLDSLEPYNHKHAERLATRLRGDSSASVVQLRCCRQKSNVECGAYVLHFTELICSFIQNKCSVYDDRCYTLEFSVDKIYNAISYIKEVKERKQNSVKHKITLLSDSHGRGLRHLLQERLEGSCEVFSMLRPSAKFETVTGDVDSELKRLGSNDHLVVLGGTNNIDPRTEFDIRSCVRQLANKTKHTNVILCTIPLRYDKPNLNCKIRKTNIELVIESLKYDHIKVVSLSNIPVKHYTSQGLHFNKWGKTKVCSSIVSKIIANLN